MMINIGLFKSCSIVFTTQAVAVDLSNGIHYVTLSPNTLIKRTHYFFFCFWLLSCQSTPCLLSPSIHCTDAFSNTFSLLFFLGFLKFFTLYYNIADYQRCDSFRCMAKGLNHVYTCIHSLPNIPPLQAAR